MQVCLIIAMPMKGLRRNDDAMKNHGWYNKIFLLLFSTTYIDGYVG